MTGSTENSVIKGPLLALTGFAVFSSHDALLKSLGEYSVFQIIFFAMLFGYVPFSIARLLEPRPQVAKANNLPLMALRAVLVVGSLCMAFLAFTLVPLVEAYVLIFTAPLFISVLAVYFLGEKLYVYRWAAIALGLLGVIVVLRPSVESIQPGHGFGIGAALCAAGAAIISRKIGNSENAATLILFPLLASIVVTGVTLPFVYRPMSLADLSVMFLIGTLGLAGQLLLINAYRASNAALIAPMQYSQIVWAVLYGSLFFGESIDRFVVIGALITVASGILIVWRESRASKVQPMLRTRNTRMVMAAPAPSVDYEDWVDGDIR